MTDKKNRKFNPRGPKKGEVRPAPKAKGSKYAKKANARKPVPKVKMGEPVFAYYVQGTDIRATKKPCLRDPEATPQRPAQSHLGTWKNPLTGKKCKVDRVRLKPQEATDESVAAA